MNNDPGNTSAESTVKSEKHLFQKVVRGGFWVFSLRIAQQLLFMARLLVLAWLLLPSDFGLLGIALISLATLETFTQTGFQAALIQTKDPNHSALNTAWTFGLLRGALLCGLIVLAAPWIVGFFDGSADLKPNQIRNPQALLQRIASPRPGAGPDWARLLSADTRAKLARWQTDQVPPEDLTEEVRRDLNRIIRQERLSDAVDVTALTESCRRRLAAYQDRPDTARQNRLLLETWYAPEIDTVLIDRQTACGVLRVISLTLLVNALVNIGLVFFHRELQFRPQFVLQFGSTLADAALSVTLAVAYRNVWALVWGRLAGQVVFLVLSYVLHPYRPRLRWDWAQGRQLWRFGKWILGSSIIGFLVLQGDNLFVGKLLGLTMLGFYQMAYRISNLPATEVSNMISRVTFPAYAKVQDDIPRLRLAYLKVLQFTCLISFPVAMLLFLFAEDFVHLVLRDKWLPMVPAMQVLAWLGLIRSVGSTFAPLFTSVGKPHISPRIQFFRLLAMAILIWPCTRLWGIAGTALSVVASGLLLQPASIYCLLREIRCRLSELIRRVFPSVVAIAVMALLVLTLRRMVSDLNPWWQFAVLLLIGLGGYVLSLLVLDRLGRYNNLGLFRDQIRIMQDAAAMYRKKT
ncbi:MAG: lipopolysaccharide biosynthesis protein [Sedimentisphaerales bacterium]|nr:lipopolysaccharide biosynthesis protein [Sedimentisphaerales bacterium]